MDGKQYTCSSCGQYVPRAPWAIGDLHPMYYVEGDGPMCRECLGKRVVLPACAPPENT